MKNYLFLLFLLTIPASALAKPIIDDGVLMKRAVKDFITTYQESGILGAIKEIDSCYKDENQKKLYCFYMDYTARIFDITMIEYLNGEGGNFQVNKYLDDKHFSERSFHYIYKPNEYSVDGINAHLNHLHYSLSQLIDQQLK